MKAAALALALALAVLAAPVGAVCIKCVPANPSPLTTDAVPCEHGSTTDYCTIAQILAGAWQTANQGTGANASAGGFSASDQAQWLVGAYTSTGTAPFSEMSIADVAANTTAGTALVGDRIDYNMNAGLGDGNRTALQAILTQNAGTTGTNDALKFYTAIFGQAYFSHNDAGTSGTPHGNVYGLAGLAELQSGATYFNGAVGAEFDVSIQSGASAAYKSVLTLIGVNSDAVHGSTYDAMLGLTRDGTTTVGFDYGIAFGRPDSTWPIDTANGVLIGAVTPGSGTEAAKGLVDFSGVTPTTFDLKLPNFYLTPVGYASFGATAAPGTALDVVTPNTAFAGGWGTDCARVGNAATTGASSGAVGLCYDRTTNIAYLEAVAPASAWDTLNIDGGTLILQNNSSGNVGIGKSPSTKLDVNGAINATGYEASGTAGISKTCTTYPTVVDGLVTSC